MNITLHYFDKFLLSAMFVSMTQNIIVQLILEWVYLKMGYETWGDLKLNAMKEFYFQEPQSIYSRFLLQ